MFNKVVPLLLFFSVSLLWISPNSANAQNCTTLEGQGTTYCPQQGGGNNQPFIGGQDNSYWETRWGAITIDNSTGLYGTAEGYASKSAASKAAIDDCKKWGGKSCKVAVAYYNQCGALVSGAKYSSTARGPTVEEALEFAMNDCKARDSTCKLFYSGCSYSQKVR